MALRYVALFLLATSALADDAKVVEYTILTTGNPSGSQVTTVRPDGAIHVSFEFNDRGRGPELEFLVRLNDAGIPIALSGQGLNYQKAGVNEQFAVNNGAAEWRSSVEHGQSDTDGRDFYVSFNDAPEMIAILARALLKSEDRSLDLLPNGNARIEALAQERVQSEDEILDITLYGIHGIDTEPMFVWLDGELELFGIDYGWLGLTRKGWESSIDVLKEVQTRETSKFFEAMSRSVSTDLQGLTAIKGARIFDSLSGELTAPATIFIWDGVISSIYLEEVAIPEDASVIEASGKTVMPSLWDMHGHVSIGNFTNYLAAGVTNVRDMGNDPEEIYRLNEEVRVGRIAGPDSYALGFIDKRGEFSAPTGMLAESVDDAISFVDYYAQHGFHGIKLYSSIEPAWVRTIADHAHDHGLPVMGHVPAYMNAEQAISAGFDEITHVNMLLLNFMGAEELDTRTPARFIVPGERAGEIDLASSEVRQLIELMHSRGIAHDPTLSIFMHLFRSRPGEASPIFSDIADHLPISLQRFLIADKGYNDGKEELFTRSADTAMRLVALLHDNGIRILPGTDNALPGFTLIRELMYYVEAGIPTNEVLQLATIESARHLGLDQRLGSISVGKDAHLIVVDGNPLEDISTLYRVENVIKGRKMFFAPDLLRAQGFVPFGAPD